MLLQISVFQSGYQHFTAKGQVILRAVLAMGAEIFLDLKFNDIPTTVARTVEAASSLGVRMLTIHLSGGSDMIRAAVTVPKNDLLILGVTVLTSANEGMLRETGISDEIDDQVLRLAKLGVARGVDGIVASPHEIKRLRGEFGDKIKIVVPGIRPSWSEPGDQKRIMSPREAIETGTD